MKKIALAILFILAQNSFAGDSICIPEGITVIANQVDVSSFTDSDESCGKVIQTKKKPQAQVARVKRRIKLKCEMGNIPCIVSYEAPKISK